MGAVCAFTAIACVDKSFNIDDVSKEVTLGSGTTTVPLGYLENKSLGDLLEGEDIEGLIIEESGNLSFSYEGESKTIEVEGISTEFEIPQIENSFEVEYPEFNFAMKAIEISEEADIEVVSGLEGYLSQGRIPHGVDLPNVECKYHHVIEGDNLHIEFDVPQQIDDIAKIIFRDIESGHHGAPMHLKVALNGLKDINAGGELKFDQNIEGGTFRILDAANNAVETKHYTETYVIEEGDEYVDFVIYVESIVNDTELDSNHHLDIPLKLTYDMEFNMATKAGDFNLSHMPHLELNANFEYGDADVVVNSEVNLVECEMDNGDPIEIVGLPDELVSVKRVSMLQGANSILNFYAHGLSWLGDLADDVEVVVGLPTYLKLHRVDNANYIYDEATGELTTTIAELDKGVAIAIEALDFGAEGCSPDANGKIALDFEPSIRAHFKDGEHVNVSSLEHNGDLEISVGIEKSNLEIESFTGKIDYAYEVEQAFEMTGLGDLDLEIDAIGLKPIIKVNITHPLTMEATIHGAVEPSVDGEVIADNVVTFESALVPAKYINGEIESTEATLVIADESLRDSYADSKYTFVACDVTKLIQGVMPDTLTIKLSLGVDPEQEQTLYIAEDLAITYDYKVDLPFAVDSSLKVRYNDEVTGLNSLFSQLADYDITVGDVTIIATVTNTTPLQLAASATLKNVDGSDANTQVAIADNAIIEGSADGVTPKESLLRFELDIEDGCVASVADVDAIVFALEATSAVAEGSVALNTNQYLGVKLQMELKGGITIDLKDFNL
jgi:hypothetical protein